MGATESALRELLRAGAPDRWPTASAPETVTTPLPLMAPSLVTALLLASREAFDAKDRLAGEESEEGRTAEGTFFPCEGGFSFRRVSGRCKTPCSSSDDDEDEDDKSRLLNLGIC